MANIDAPNGFHHVGSVYGNSMQPRIHHFTIAAAVSGAIGVGQPCKLGLATGHIVELNGTFANDSGDTEGAGIYICQKAGAVAGDTGVPFIAAAGAIFSVQGDNDWAPANQAAVETIIGTGHCYGITNVNSISTDGLNRSIAELDGNFSAADEGYLMLTGWSTSPRNEFGPFQDLFVRFHPALFARSIDHVMLAQA